MEPACCRPVKVSRSVAPGARSALVARACSGRARRLSGQRTRRLTERVASSELRVRLHSRTSNARGHRGRDTAEPREHSQRFGAHNTVHLGGLVWLLGARTFLGGRRAMSCVSGASSMRGGRSTRASHQSRTPRLTPSRADATGRIACLAGCTARPEPPRSRTTTQRVCASEGDHGDRR
jgi:hypothetical protein